MSQTTTIELSQVGYTSDLQDLPLATISHHVSLPTVARIEGPGIPLLDEGTQILSNRRTITIIATLTGLGFLSSLSTGLLTIGLPQIAVEVGLPGYLLSWYEQKALILSKTLSIISNFFSFFFSSINTGYHADTRNRPSSVYT
jgi:hypothetical protein